jgi:hypothetical protein
MHGIVNRILKRLRSQAGFSMIEIMVGGFVLVVGLVVMAQFFASAASRIMESDVRSVLHQVATQDLESIRGLDYNDVGTTDGHPQGVLAPDENRTVQNLTVRIHREVVFWTDSSYTGPYPANYRRVTVSVAAVNHDALAPVEVTSNVAGGVPGGSLDITVTDITGAPVPDAQIVITNTHLIPNVNINSAAIRTDSNGKMIVPGLTPDDTPNYVVTVSKAGYNTAVSDPSVVVDGLPYTVVQLTIDRLSTMNVRVIDTNGDAVAGLNLTIVGPEGFTQSFASVSSGTAFTDVRYSTDTDPYIVRLVEGQGYDAQEQAIVLAPGTTQDVVFTVPAGGPTTTTTVPPVTTTTIVAPTTTTTTSGGSSLTLTVVRSSNGNAVDGATVWLSPGGQVGTTNSSGIVRFTGLSNQTYSIVITRSNYYDYRGDVVVTGATSATIRLDRRW